MLAIGMDVGSTTVKATVVDSHSRKILWHDYQRHHTRQAELVLSFLLRIRTAFPDQSAADFCIFLTGSGATPLIPLVGAKFVQEVNAVSLAVEALHPEAGSAIELGGQDAKILIFKQDPKTGRRQIITSMNDKCASGTGATIDKCMVKAGIAAEEALQLHFNAEQLHPVAAKCGVFAETDIVNLVKTGVPAHEILCSLANAIVMQNLSVLARGNTLRHQVLLLGGPNCYLPFLQECWQQRIPETWNERNHDYPQGVPVEKLIFVPENAALFAAYGAVLYGLQEPTGSGRYLGEEALTEFIRHGRQSQLAGKAGPPLASTADELADFRSRYTLTPFRPPLPPKTGVLSGYLGLDGGSTSSKCVVVGEAGEILLKSYLLSRGNPVQDMKAMLQDLRNQANAAGVALQIRGFGVTGYAANVLDASLLADVNIVETIAHLQSATHYFPEVEVICDVGGQDIKVMMVQRGDLKNFRLSNQCSAGNGMLLQAMADQFGTPVREYADHAFAARLSPDFSYGCAVFLDSDRVNFQKEGFSKEEMMAGLARVLPKNIWQYVAQIPRLAELGRYFVLQGGTQHNLAAVKAQVDYICERVPDAVVSLHPHPGEAGAIGAALEAMRVVRRRGKSRFIGLEAAIGLVYTTRTDAATTCRFCPNHCTRTFIDTVTPDGGSSRYIAGFSCELGQVEDSSSLRRIEEQKKERKRLYPNLVAEEANLLFRHFFAHDPLPEAGAPLTETVERRGLSSLFLPKTLSRSRPFQRSPAEAANKRRELRIALPRALNLWSTAPFWRTYFETLGIPPSQIVWSDETSESMFNAGARYGSVDPCFPAKVVQAHIHNILFHKHRPRRKVNFLFFPSITHLPGFLENTMDSTSCPVVAGTPNVMKAAFTKESDLFARHGIDYVDSAMTMNEPNLLAEQLFQTWEKRLLICRDENDFAVAQAFRALQAFQLRMEEQGRELIENLEATGRIGILLLGRPYHNDPGIHHEIPDAFQAEGYPVLTIGSIPKDKNWLARYFSDKTLSPLDITDLWPENYSTNSAQKVWAASFAARCPNLAVLDLSSFKCGHDAPTYGIIDRILSAAGTPMLALHDIDSNKPSGSIHIRIQTAIHTLRQREEALADASAQPAGISRHG